MLKKLEPMRIVIFSIFVLGELVVPRQAKALDACGPVSGNTTWTSAQSPIDVTCGVTVPAGYSLTVEPGVEVRFAAGTSLIIGGQLTATGTSTSHIVFRATSSPAAAGSWSGIAIKNNEGGKATLGFVDIFDAGAALSVQCCGGGGPVTVDDSQFINNVTALAGYAGWSMIVRRTKFENNTFAVSAADKTISDSVFINNQYGLYRVERTTVSNSTFSGHEVAVWGFNGITATGNQITGNATGVRGFVNLMYNNITGNAFGVELPGGDIQRNNIYNNTAYDVKNTTGGSYSLPNNWWGSTDACTIEAKIFDGADDASLGLAEYSPVLSSAFNTSPTTIAVTRCPASDPNGIYTDTVWTAAQSPHVFTSSVYVFPGVTLTVEPGVQVRFAPGTGLTVRGALTANGTAAAPITFGGTVTGNKAAWNGIYLATSQGAKATLQFSVISDAGAALLLECCGGGGPVTVDDSQFINNVTALAGYAGWSMIVRRTKFENNTFAVSAADKTISDSVFINNQYGLYRVERTTVSNSTFSGHEVALWGFNGITATGNQIAGNATGVRGFVNLMYNNITGNAIGIELPGGDIQRNNIYYNTTYDAKNTTASGYSLPNNWWGTTDLVAIDAHLFDRNDSPALGLIDVNPILTGPSSQQVATSTFIASSLNPSTYGATVTFTATETSSAGTPTGTVTFSDGPTTLGTAALNGSGVATVTISTLAAGSHTITAAYGGATEFAASSGNLPQTINQATSSTMLTSSLNPATYGQETTLTVTVASTAGIPTGSVTFKDGATTLGSSTLNGSGQAALVIGLTVGIHSLTAVYGGSTNFSGSTSSAVSESVSKATTTTTLTSSPNPSTIGQTVNFVATVLGQYGGAITGTVTFKRGTNTVLGTATVVGGAATLSLSDLGTGPHVVTATYGGDGNSTGNTSAAVTQTVAGLPTTSTGISSSLNPSIAGQLVTLTAVVTSATLGTPTGMVTFRQGSSTVLGTMPLSSGQATFSSSTLPAGSLGITAVYSGDAQFAGSTSATLTQVVSKASTSTTLSSSPNPSNVGQQVTFSVSVSSTGAMPTGVVNINEGNTTLGSATLNASGAGSFSTSTLTSGRHNLKAVYVGDPKNAGSTSNTVQQVVR